MDINPPEIKLLFTWTMNFYVKKAFPVGPVNNVIKSSPVDVSKENGEVVEDASDPFKNNKVYDVI